MTDSSRRRESQRNPRFLPQRQSAPAVGRLDPLVRIGSLLAVTIVVGCGGTAQTQTQTQTDSGVDSSGSTLYAACAAGTGRDMVVGPGDGQIAELEQVPWESLAAGDTVRIHHRATPYRGKFLITGSGTESAPLRICGIKGANGERPIIEGANAVTRSALNYGSAYAGPIFEARSVITIKGTEANYTDFPRHIRIDGLTIRGAHPANQFTDRAGVLRRYDEFGGCIWIDRGEHITLADLEVTDCTNGIFSKSTDDGPFAVTKDIRLTGNDIHGNGIAGSDRLHGVYMQSVGVVYEFNVFGPARTDALGNAIKDRSVGSIVRYNRIEEGAHAVDLVEAEDFPTTATADPAYRATYVYGNQIIKRGDTGSVIHYGGDHYTSEPGAQWGEPIFRKGTLYFFNNTVHVTGSQGVLFNLSTTDEKAQIWNNVFYFDPTVQFPSMRQSSDVGQSWVAGGIVNLGRNWINETWADSDPYHQVPGELNGKDQLLTGTAPPIDLTTLRPNVASTLIDSAQSGPASAAEWTVEYELDQNFQPKRRVTLGAGNDIGALEGSGF